MMDQRSDRETGHLCRDTALSLTLSSVDKYVYLTHMGSKPPAWLARLSGQISRPRPTEVAVLVGTSLPEDGAEELCQLLAPVLDARRDTHIRLLSLVMAAGAREMGDRPSVARLICERWGLDVLATAGTALITAQGTLFSPDLPGAPGGWWHFAPGTAARQLNRHLPVTEWDSYLKHLGRQTLAGHVVEPVPAGLSLRPTGPASPAVHIRPHTIPPHPKRPCLIVPSPDVPAAALAVVMASLPDWIRQSLVLVSLNGQAMQGTGQAVADLLGSDVRIAIGAPVLTGRGIRIDDAPTMSGSEGRDGDSVPRTTAEPRVTAIMGRASWPPFARTSLCTPTDGGGWPATTQMTE
ncbi:hypothetical protein ACWD3Z_39755 [Streptomyces sp. NPDC002740]